MKKILQMTYVVPVFMLLGLPLFLMARVSSLEPASLRLARLYARLVLWVQGRRPKQTAEALAEEWNRLMPEPRKIFPVVAVEDDTAYMEIRASCLLRGSGDGEACWRAMEFDRALVEASGGQLVVMRSQAVEGYGCCKLAIRPKGQSLEELTVAHPRWRSGS